jgi:hypothetical protein
MQPAIPAMHSSITNSNGVYSWLPNLRLEVVL